jgi:hypothetical protein
LLKLVDGNDANPAARSQNKRKAAGIDGGLRREPETTERRRNPSLNAVRHNFCSESLVLNNEQRPRYQALSDGCLETFCPSGPIATDSSNEWLPRNRASRAPAPLPLPPRVPLGTRRRRNAKLPNEPGDVVENKQAAGSLSAF